MRFLALVSIIWAFSFGLIGNALSGLDSFFVTSVRLGLATLIFLPFFRFKKLPPKQAIQLFGCGAVQFGIMYVCYIKAFTYIPSHLVALFSVMTPIYVVLIHDLRHKQWTARYIAAAGLSVIGAVIIKAKLGESETLWIGFGLMQLAGLAFAFGQVYYRDWKARFPDTENRNVFALLYLGGVSFALLASSMQTDWAEIEVSMQQWLVLLYLGVIASGLCFFLWNKGATLCKPGTLAAFNNVVVPLAMVTSLFIFGEINQVQSDQMIRLILGGTFIFAAVYVAERDTPKNTE
ncbi:MAG TPA: EamA family transporter [Opitutae bacterium]|nr:EamA family transporter [Opitutae bacterium]